MDVSVAERTLPHNLEAERSVLGAILLHNDLRESGALEQDADVVVFIYREDQYNKEDGSRDDMAGIAELIVAKQRNGPTGVVKTAFIREFTRFENLALGR